MLPECRRAEISDAEKFMKYIAGYVSNIYGVPVERFDESFNAGIEKLAAEKYSTDEWNSGAWAALTPSVAQIQLRLD